MAQANERTWESSRVPNRWTEFLAISRILGTQGYEDLARAAWTEASRLMQAEEEEEASAWEAHRLWEALHQNAGPS